MKWSISRIGKRRLATLEGVTSVISALLALATIVWKDWIEVFGIEPDNGDGSLEWLLAGCLAMIAGFLALLARRHRWQSRLLRERTPYGLEGEM